MIFATNASPRPDPDGLVVTNGSNRCGSRSSGTPGPLSLMQNSIGSDTRDRLPGSVRRTPGRNAVVMLDLAVDRVLADRLGGVLHEIEET